MSAPRHRFAIGAKNSCARNGRGRNVRGIPFDVSRGCHLERDGCANCGDVPIGNATSGNNVFGVSAVVSAGCHLLRGVFWNGCAANGAATTPDAKVAGVPALVSAGCHFDRGNFETSGARVTTFGASNNAGGDDCEVSAGCHLLRGTGKNCGAADGGGAGVAPSNAGDDD